ncbi:MAG: DUF2236 domain-containing protein [Deltaproteobacteria bacterium]|nr:MAG: DUF2236 domain-containing protein [Deltaproteobacteria bacterium]
MQQPVVRTLQHHELKYAPTPSLPTNSYIFDADGFYTSQTLLQMKQTGDPEADALVEELYSQGGAHVESFNRAMAELHQGKDWLRSESRRSLPSAMIDFLGKGRDVGKSRGGWDEERLRNGARVHRRYSFHTTLVLQLATMPYLYAARNAMKVLVSTQRLKDDAQRRSAETAQMFFDVMHPHCFTPEGYGWRSCQKVRLLHAAVRTMILRSGCWDKEAWGVPINQQEMIGTLYGFSILVLDGLRELGAEISDADREDFYYRWQAVGEWLGIQPKFISTNIATATKNQARMEEQQFGESPEGQVLIESWMEALQGMAPLERMKPYASAAIECMVGPKVSRFLGLQSTPDELATTRKVLRQLGPPDRWLRPSGWGRKAFDVGMHSLLMVLFVKERGLQRPSFALPVRKR